jgi:hypothetical protein
MRKPGFEERLEPVGSESTGVLEEAAARKPTVSQMPSMLTQFAVLTARRWKLFFRDRGQLALQLALMFGFPILVVLFALEGLPQLPSPGGADRESMLTQLMLVAETREKFVRTGTLVSGTGHVPGRPARAHGLEQWSP